MGNDFKTVLCRLSTGGKFVLEPVGGSIKKQQCFLEALTSFGFSVGVFLFQDIYL